MAPFIYSLQNDFEMAKHSPNEVSSFLIWFHIWVKKWVKRKSEQWKTCLSCIFSFNSYCFFKLIVWKCLYMTLLFEILINFALYIIFMKNKQNSILFWIGWKKITFYIFLHFKYHYQCINVEAFQDAWKIK